MPSDLKSLLASAELHAVTDSVRDYAIFLLDPAGTILTWNAGAERLKGYRPDEIIGQSFERFYTEGDRAAGRPWKLLEEAAREGRVEDESWRLRKDGTRFWADVVISRIVGSGGNVIGFTKVTRDLSDRRRTEEKLRQSEDRMRLMIAAVKDYAIFMLDPDGRVASWNTGAERLKQFTAHEIIGQHLSRFYPPEDVAAGKPQREIEIATATGRFEEEGWRVRKDGSRFWANVVLSAVHDADNRLIGFTKVTRDMTERRRAADELAARARQQSAVAELGVYALQVRDLPLMTARAMAAVRDVLRVDDVRILASGDVPAPGWASAGIHSPDADEDFGLLVALSPGSLSTTDMSFLQAIANVIAAAFARSRVEERLRAAEREAVEERGRTAQAEQALRERDDFISMAAHELRTPLTALQLKLQGMGRAGLDADRKTERLTAAIRQTQRLSQLVDRLLDVSRISQGRVEMKTEIFDLAALVRQAVDDFREPSAQARAPIEVHAPDSVPGTWDRLRVEQVVVNLLSNAVKYGAGKPIRVTLDATAQSVRLTVADRGIGICAEDVNRIFGRFQRAAPLRNYGGLGLGLYIARHIVEAHGGTISVDSTVGEGATFVVDLPRVSEAAEPDRMKAHA